MATYDCDDLRMSFEPDGTGAYRLRVVDPEFGEVRSTFVLPMPTDELEQAVLALGQMRSGTREVRAAVADAKRADAEQLGGRLGAALFDSVVGPFYDTARRRSASRGRGVRLTLSLADAPELLSVPWEILYRRPSFIASQRRTPVVRYLEIGSPPPPERIDGPVRVLGVVANPTGLAPLDVTEERARVERALDPMCARGLVVLEWCDPATPRSLRERLRDGSFHVLHYIGHSDFTERGDGLLYLEDDAGGPARVTEAVLTNLLGDQTSLRLAILNSCEGARTTLTDPFAGIATSLVALGVPAVIAMQFPISDRAAIVFAEELFTSLIGRQYPIDAAVAEARKAVFTEVNEIEWATPVLFLRAPDGRLFDFTSGPEHLPLPVAPTPIVIEETVPAVATTVTRVAGPTPATPAAPTHPPVQVAPATVGAPAGTPPQRSRRRWLVVAAVLVLAGGGAAWAAVADDGDGDADATEETSEEETSEESGDSDSNLELSETTVTPDTTIDFSADSCPSPDWVDASAQGFGYSLHAEIDGAVTELNGSDGDVDHGIEDWTGSVWVPDDLPPGTPAWVEAYCWYEDAADGERYTYYEYADVGVEIVEP